MRRQLQSRKYLKFEGLEDRWLLAADVKLVVVDGPAKQAEPQAIVGGDKVLRGTYGWVASLQDGFGHFCGGTLVAPDAVITAAHCVEGQTISELTAVVGREDLTTSDGQRAGVSQIIIHPDYDSHVNDADIAVLLLTDVVNEQPIGYLSNANATLAWPGVTATVLGWGTTREGGLTVTNLREVQVPIVSNQSANASNSYDGQISPTMLPAGQQSGGIDSCQGDSGGPLIVRDASDNPQLAGVVSWGEGCGRANKYGIYSRVSSFAPWIDEILGIGELGQVNFNQGRYVSGSDLQLIVRDSNVAGQTLEVTVQSDSGDVETVTLTAFANSRYRGNLAIEEAAPAKQDGILNVLGKETIWVSYEDQDDGLGKSARVTSMAQIVVDDVANQANGAAVVSLDQAMDGEIEVRGDVDWFQFDVVAGQGYEISIKLVGTLNDSTVAIYAADGETLLGFNDDSGRGLDSKITFFPNDSGSIFIEAAGFGANVGSYQLLITEVTVPSDDHSDIVGGATLVTLDEVHRGLIDPSSDADWFQLDVETGVIYQIDVLLDTLRDSELSLVDADGRTELAYNDDRSNSSRGSQIFYRAESTGRRFFRVTSFGRATGTYRVRVTTIEDDHGNDATHATALGKVATEGAEALGAITPQDVDWFRFLASVDKFYEIQTFANSSSMFDDTVIHLFDEKGIRLASNDDHLDELTSRIVWQAPYDGEFFVEIAAFQQTSAEYRLVIRELAQAPLDDVGNRSAHALDLKIPGEFRGKINYESDIDWFRLKVNARRTYRFKTELRSLEDSVLRLFDRDGQSVLLENDDVDFPDRSSFLEWTAATTGVRYLQISGFDGLIGTYTLITEADALPGDLNKDGQLDATDIDALFAAINTGETGDPYDLNSDGLVNRDDADVLIGDFIGTIAGDADLDGQVQFSDFILLAENFNAETNWSGGDFDGSGVADFSDFLILARNFGRVTPLAQSRVANGATDGALLAYHDSQKG